MAGEVNRCHAFWYHDHICLDWIEVFFGDTYNRRCRAYSAPKLPYIHSCSGADRTTFPRLQLKGVELH